MPDDPFMVSVSVASRLAEVRLDADKAYAAFHADPSRQVDMDFAAGALLGHLTTLEKAVRLLATAHAPVQLCGPADDCGHERPGIHPGAAQAGIDAWDDWDEGHPQGTPLVEGGEDPGRICLASPLGKPACAACTELAQSVTGDDTGDPVPADECIVLPLISKHLLGQEATDDRPQR